MSLVSAGGGLTPVGARLVVAGENEFHRAFKSAGNSVLGFADLATTSFKGVGSVMTLVGGGILAAAGAAVKGAAGFESAMRNVQTISKTTQADFEGMSQSVMDVARDTNQAGQQAAEGLYQIVSSGFDGAEAIDVLKASSVAAAAGLTDVFTAATAVASVLNSYGLAASESADISDILFQTVNFGVGSFEELAQAVPLVTGLAAQAKIPFDETAAAIAAASRAGLSFADASVGVSRIIQELLDPSDQLQAVLTKVGYTSGAAALEQDGFREVLEKIRAEVGGNTEAYVQMFGRIEGIRLALALAVNDGKAYAEATEQIANEHNRAGAAAKAYAIQQKATEKAAGDLANSLKQLGQSALMPLLGLFRRAFEGAKILVDVFDKLPAPIKAGAGVAAIFAGALMLLIGVAFVALPRLVIIAILTFVRYNQSLRDMIVPTLQAAAAHDVLARAMLKVFTMSANTGLIGGLVKGIGLMSVAVAVASGAMIFLSGSIKEASEWVAKLQGEMTNAEMTKAAKDWERAWTDGADNVKQSILQAMSVSMVGGGSLVDFIPGADRMVDQARYFASKVTGILGFSLGSNREAREEAEKGFRELARTNIEAARRMLDSAMAAGANGAQISFMTKEIREAEKAAKESGQASDEAAASYVNSAGQVLAVSDEIKDSLEDFRSDIDDIQNAFGGLFADPTQEARDLADAVRDAHDATLEAEADLEKARESAAEHVQDRSRKIRDAERELANARRAAARSGRTVDDPTTRLPEPVVRRKDESEIDYQKRVAEAAQRSAEIQAKAADTITNRQDQMAGASDRVRAAEERLAEARAGTGEDMDQIAEAEKRLVAAKEAENKATEASIVTGEKLQANLQAQVNATLGFYMALEALRAKGAPRELISQLAKIGPEAGRQIEALAKMDPSGLQKYFQTWRDSASAAAAVALEQFDPMQDKSKIAAKLNELWTMVGGDVGKFLLLGAGAGDDALRDFIHNKIDAATGEAKLKLAAMIPPEYQMRLKIEIDTAAAKSAVEQAKVWGSVIANVLGLGKPLPAPPPPGAPTTGLPGLWSPPVVANPGSGFFSGMPGGGVHAEGTITKGPEVALVGEAGTEAIIPLTKPKRALQLMRQAGLDKLIAEEAPHRAEGGIFGESMSIPVASTASKDPTQKKWRDYAIRVSAYAQLLDATKIQQTMQHKFITRVTERVKDVEQDRQLVPRSRVVNLGVPRMAEGGVVGRVPIESLKVMDPGLAKQLAAGYEYGGDEYKGPQIPNWDPKNAQHQRMALWYGIDNFRRHGGARYDNAKRLLDTPIGAPEKGQQVRVPLVHALTLPRMAEGGIFDRLGDAVRTVREAVNPHSDWGFYRTAREPWYKRLITMAARGQRDAIDLLKLPYDPRPHRAPRQYLYVGYGDVRDPQTGERLRGDALRQAIDRAGKPLPPPPAWLEVGEGAMRAPIPTYQGEQSPMFQLAALPAETKMRLAGAKTLDFGAVARWSNTVRTASPYERYAQAFNETRLRQAAQRDYAARATAYGQALSDTQNKQAERRRAEQYNQYLRMTNTERNEFLRSPQHTQSIFFAPGFATHAQGSILKEAQTVIAGEAGAEAIIPITKPRRALAIMKEAGLDQLVIRESIRNQRVNSIEQRRMPVFAAGGIVGNSAVATSSRLNEQDIVADRRTVVTQNYNVARMQLADWRTAKRQMERDASLHRLGTPT